MLKKNKLSKLLVALILCFLAFASVNTLSSCRKNKDCTAIITVIDTAGAVLNNASVRLYYDPNNGKGFVESTQATDASGKTTFVFKLQAIFDTDITYGGKTAKKAGIVMLEPGATVSKTLTFK